MARATSLLNGGSRSSSGSILVARATLPMTIPLLGRPWHPDPVAASRPPDSCAVRAKAVLRATSVLEHDLRERPDLGLRQGELGDHAAGDGEKGRRLRAVRLRHHRRPAGVGLLADAEVERDLAQELDAVFFRRQPGAAVAEDLGPVAAARAQEVAHVLDDAQNRHIDLAEHVERLARIEQGY